MPDRFPIAELALEFLERGASSSGEPYGFPPHGRVALAALLEALFETGGDPGDALEDLLRLACVLEIELRSPSAAELVLSTLRSDPRVSAALSGVEPSEVPRALIEWAGGRMDVRAPMYGIDAPEGTVKASSLVTSQGPHLRGGENEPRERPSSKSGEGRPSSRAVRRAFTASD